MLSSAMGVTWQGTSGNNRWSRNGNWNPNNRPTSTGETATFENGGFTNVNVNGTGYTIGTLEFTGKTFTLTNNALTFNNSGTAWLNMSATGSPFVDVNLILANNLNIDHTGSGVLTLAGNISQSGGTRTITKLGSGTTILSGSNSYSGTTTISNGVILAAHDKALGATNNGTTVTTNGALHLSNNITITDEALNLSGNGISSGGALRSVSGTNISTGLITATSTTTALGAATNSALVVSNINSGSQEMWVVGEGTTVIAGSATNSGSGTAFVKTNSGTAILMSSNAWSGAEYIRQGTVIISNNNAFGTGGTTYLGTATATNPLKATLQLGASITNSNAISVLADGNPYHELSYQQGSGTAAQLGGVTLNSNNLNLNVKTNGTLLFGGTVTANASSGNEARLVIDGGGTVIVTNNGTAPTNDYYQVRVGNGTLIIGSGSIQARTNTAGAGHGMDLGIGPNWSVASGPSTVLASNGVTVSNSIFVIATNSAARTLGISGTGTSTFTGPIALSDTPLTVTADAGGTAIFSGAITNFSGSTNNRLTKIGAGTVVLSGTNNYGGATTISNGTLRVSTLANAGSSSSIGTNANIILAGSNSAAAVFDYTGGNVTMNRNFIATNGGGTINMASNTVVTHTGSASGSGTIEISKGTLVLSNTGTPNAFAPGAIKVDSGATLQIAADNQIGNSTGLILNGGTFRIGTSTTQFSDQLGTLTVSADSVIDLGSWTGGSTPRQLSFADSSSITWTGTLTISNWQGVAMTSSDVAEILFGVGGLSSSQLSQIVFANQGINGGALIGGNGELVPIPEPKVYAAAAVLLLSIIWIERRRIKSLLKKCRLPSP